MAALAVGWVITFVILYVFRAWLFGSYTDDFARGILAAWIGELTFFTLIGGIISVMTLKNPMEERFDERMRIMFGQPHMPDAVMKYNKGVISRLSAYAKTGSRLITLETFDPATSAYKARIKTEYHIFNLFSDTRYSDTIKISIKPDDFQNPKPSEIGRVISIKIDGVESVTNPLIFDNTGFSSEIRIEIPENGSRIFFLEFMTWIKVGELQALRPQRVVEQFSMDIVSQCDQNPRVEIDGDVRVLLYNQPLTLPIVQGVSPGERVGVYTPLTPAP